MNASTKKPDDSLAMSHYFRLHIVRHQHATWHSPVKHGKSPKVYPENGKFDFIPIFLPDRPTLIMTQHWNTTCLLLVLCGVCPCFRGSRLPKYCRYPSTKYLGTVVITVQLRITYICCVSEYVHTHDNSVSSTEYGKYHYYDWQVGKLASWPKGHCVFPVLWGACFNANVDPKCAILRSLKLDGLSL